MTQTRGRDVVGRVCADRVLWAAWAKVAAGSGMPGVDGVSVEMYARRLGANLDELRALLRTGRYQSQPVKRLMVGREGKERVLGVPTVRDRVAQRAFLEVLRRQLEAELSEVSFAYRRGKSWLGALRLAEQCRDQGLRWVFRGDIASYFDTISHQRLRGQLTRLIRDRAAVDIIMQWVSAPILTDNGLIVPHAGVPQGGLCEASHKPPYGQRWVMRSARGLPLVGAVAAVGRCA